MLGRYRVLEPLGRGGMAQVYRAYHPQLDRYVAIKILRSDLVEDEAFLGRFQREARAVANLRHPHIVQVYDFDAEDDTYYMVMEYLEGDTLKARLDDYRIRGEPMPWGEVVRILLDVLDGLAYAHDEGMVHRDIKPSNILLTRSGRAVVSDFGIAQIVGGARYTTTGTLMGTPEYMAPEQGLRGESNACSDLYSLGVILYEMLTQRIPFDAETPLAILLKHVNDPLPPPRQIQPGIPEPLERIVLKAMAKQPEDRYPEARAMAEALWQASLEAEIELPARVSLPMSFTTQEVPSESVAVISEPAGKRRVDAGVAEADTDPNLGEHLLNAQASPTGNAGAPTGRRELSKAIFMAIGVVALGNLLGVMLSSFFENWAIFEVGWPMEILLTGGALFMLMAVSETIWLSIPAGLLTANGLLLAYSALTGNWHHWIFLWIVEPWMAAATVITSIHLAREPANARRVSRLLGWAFGVAAVIAALAVQGAALASTFLSGLFASSG